MRLSGMPRPEKMGVFAGAAAGGAFLGALAASELVLLLTGGILAGLLAYTFIALALLAGIHRKRVPAIVAALSPAVLTAGDSAELRVKAPVKMFELPGCLVRYRLKLGAASGRSIDQVFPLKLFSGAPCPVPAAYRGAYYGAQDEIVFFDFFGFWRASIPLPQGEAPRLCVCPVCLPELRQPDFAAGGSGERRGQSAVKPEEFYDNRPYVPGDDPRRLNWKLYGHSGELFVREALRQTPPNACLTIIVDTETDPGLLNGEAALHAVDVLCSAALTFAALSAERGCAVRLLRTDAHTNNVNMGAFAACLRQSANRAIRSNLAASQPNSASIPCAAQGATRLADSQRPPCRESTIGYESDALPAGERGNGTFELNPKPKKGPCPPTAGGDGVLPTDAGYDGSETLEGEAAETAWIEQELSFPAAIPLGTGDSLGKTAGGGDVFYLALPRCPGEAENPPSALDKFLAGSSRRADGTAAKNIKIIFIYPKNIHNGAAKKIEYAAYSNALWYGAKGAAGAESIGT